MGLSNSNYGLEWQRSVLQPKKPTMLPRIGFDIDGCLADFTTEFIKVVNWLYPAKRVPPGYQPKDWQWTEILSKTEFSVIWSEISMREDWWMTFHPLPGLFELLPFYEQAANTTHEIYFISSRGPTLGLPVIQQTELWLQSWGLPHARVWVVEHANEKRDMIRALGLQAYIDDFLPTVLGVKDITHAYLLEQSWNEQERKGYYLSTVKSVKEFLEKEANFYVPVGDRSIYSSPSLL